MVRELTVQTVLLEHLVLAAAAAVEEYIIVVSAV
jgi:hypothetical protein